MRPAQDRTSSASNWWRGRHRILRERAGWFVFRGCRSRSLDLPWLSCRRGLRVRATFVSSAVCSAIMRSSSVGMTKTMAGEVFALMICALARLASSSIWMPIHSMPVSTALRTSPGIFADAAGEDDAVEAADGGGEAGRSRGGCGTRNNRSRRARRGCRRPRARACPGRCPTCP